jgi:hypothetical protein
MMGLTCFSFGCLQFDCDSLPRTLLPWPPKQQIAKMPIQVPSKEQISLDNINFTSIEYWGKSWFPKLLIEKETADQVLPRLRPMQTQSVRAYWASSRRRHCHASSTCSSELNPVR